MIDSISGPRRSSISASSSASGSRDVGSAPVKSKTLRRSRLMQPVRLPSSLSSGTSSGCASPNVRRQRATVSAKSARACSSLVTATARGLSIAAHSRHNSRVASSISSFAGTTNSTASAARRPARTSPTKSGVPRGVEQIDHARPAGHRGGDQGVRRARLAARVATRQAGGDQPLEQGRLPGPRRSDEDDVADLLGRFWFACSIESPLPMAHLFVPRRPEHKRGSRESCAGDWAPKAGRWRCAIRPGTAGYASDPVNGREGQACQNEIRSVRSLTISASPPGSADR